MVNWQKAWDEYKQGKRSKPPKVPKKKGGVWKRLGYYSQSLKTAGKSPEEIKILKDARKTERKAFLEEKRKVSLAQAKQHGKMRARGGGSKILTRQNARKAVDALDRWSTGVLAEAGANPRRASVEPTPRRKKRSITKDISNLDLDF